jgi:hypothetical protein
MRLGHTFVTLTLSLASVATWAQAAAPAPAATPRVDQRQANQEQRIEQGVASGQLTPRETLRLEREQKRVAVAEQKAKADGTVTAAERKKLHHMQDHASKDIRHQKHDRQHMPGAASAAKP